MAERLPELEEKDGSGVDNKESKRKQKRNSILLLLISMSFLLVLFYGFSNKVAVYSRGSTEGYTRQEINDIDSAKRFSENRAKDMADLIEEVNRMGWFKRFFDSKVSNEERRFWYFFTLKPSDPKALKKDIDKHREFYNSIQKALLKARNGDEEAGEILQDLYEKLVQFCADEKLQIDKDRSRKLSKLHQAFVDERDKLENTIRRVEVCNSRMEQRNTNKKLNSALDSIKELTRGVRESEIQTANLIERASTLMDMNQQLLQRQAQCESELERSRRSYESLEKKFDTILTLNQQLMGGEKEKEEQRQKERQTDKEQMDLMMTLLKDLLKKPPHPGNDQS